MHDSNTDAILCKVSKIFEPQIPAQFFIIILNHIYIHIALAKAITAILEGISR